MEADWKNIKEWYDKKFVGDWEQTGVNEVVPDNYGSSELSSAPLGPNYNVNNLRDKYMKDLRNDIKLLATPQMRTAREYYLWFTGLKEKAEGVRGELLKLKTSAKELKDIANNWDINIGNMAESGVKNDMRQDYNTKTKAVIEGYVTEMTKIFERSKDYSNKVIANLEKYEYAGIQPAT